MKTGKVLLIHADAGDIHLPEYLARLRHLLTREFSPFQKITIEAINGAPAGTSLYVDAFKTVFNVLVEHKKLTLYRKMDFEC
jgi:hypothetical protein